MAAYLSQLSMLRVIPGMCIFHATDPLKEVLINKIAVEGFQPAVHLTTDVDVLLVKCTPVQANTMAHSESCKWNDMLK